MNVSGRHARWSEGEKVHLYVEKCWKLYVQRRGAVRCRIVHMILSFSVGASYLSIK